MQQQAQALSKQSTGNEIVDRNLDECERHLKQLKGQAYLIGHQLDESTAATLQRHNKILKNYSQEDSRTKVSQTKHYFVHPCYYYFVMFN